MSNKSYRIRTNISEDKFLNVNIEQDFDILEVLSLKISTENLYKLHSSNYGCIVGRVLANGGVGVPNAKISIFIAANEKTNEDDILQSIYPFTGVHSKNNDGIRYNLLPDEQVAQCHKQVGTFPNKRLVLDDDNVLEIFDEYYKFTTTSNRAGDYMIFGVPVGEQTIHMDLDLSDIGILSQKPIDLMYKGYDKSQFDSASQFKGDTNLNSLTQIISQNTTVNVYPFWGDSNEGEIKITRNDIDVNYKFEPTCIFMGSMVTDTKNDAFSKKCIPSVNMGRMDKLTTGNGTIEMIRKKTDGSVEEFVILGNELIDGNGTWCYQIPMNLDYITTDEYGNLTPTDNPEKGIATRARVRFRVSLSDYESDYINNHLTKILVPHNPNDKEGIDYAFGDDTKDNEEGSGSFRDLLWNNVYTVKSYIPRIQKGNNNRTNKFSGFKNVNVNGSNNPIPYNNMRVNVTFMFVLQCAIIKCLLFFIKVYNWMMKNAPGLAIWKKKKRRCGYVGDGLCPDLEGWYFAPGCGRSDQMRNTFNGLKETDSWDKKSIDYQNKDSETICLTNSIDYLTQCVEINLAMENEVIKFDFYNDWINGLLYIPRWFINIKKKKTFLFGLIRRRGGVRACTEENFGNTRRLTQQCSLTYTNNSDENNKAEEYIFSKVITKNGCSSNKKQKCHRSKGRDYVRIMGVNGGIVHDEKTYKGQSVYYPRPCEWISEDKKCNLFATDIVLLGNLSDCNIYGIPNSLGEISSSTYQLPPNLLQSNMDSDGVLYGIGTKNICSNKTTTRSVEEIEPTFENYLTWSKGQDFYEDNPDDITEYAVAEMSGIDWGISGPGQGKNNLSDLFFPGGHFLGISCVNAQVNIKSCVNLSRICEYGSLMSQRQSKIVKGNNETEIYKYAYLIPSGFISKDEISDSNFRNIFSTLNHNRLKTRTDENGLRRYDFISKTPINYNGALEDRIGTSYNNSSFTEPDGVTSGITRTMEDNSRDYYDFRMGVRTEEDKINIRNRFLLSNNKRVSMPVYENSFYFYFGMKDGSTSLDRLHSDYFATCPEYHFADEPKITYEVVDEITCTRKGSIKFEIENIPLPYSYTFYHYENDIMKEYVGVVGDDSSSEITLKKTIEFNDLDSGKYALNVVNDLRGINTTKYVIINKELPKKGEVENSNLYYDSIEIDTTDFNKAPVIKITNDGDKYIYTVSSSSADYGSGIKISAPKYDTGKNPPYPIGFILVSGGFYGECNINKDGFWHASAAANKILDTTKYNRIEVEYSVKDNNNGDVIIDIDPWIVNNEIIIYLVYSCEELSYDGEYYKILDYRKMGSYSVNTLSDNFDYYIYDETITLNELNEAELLYGTTNKVNNIKSEDGSVTSETINSFTINVKELAATDKLTAQDIWKIKKSITFNTSLFEYEPHNMNIGYVGGTAPFENLTIGRGEVTIEGDEDTSIAISNSFYRGESAADKGGYLLDLSEIYVPSIPWRYKTIKNEANYGNDGMYITKEKDSYYYYIKSSKSSEEIKYLNRKYFKLDTYYRPFFYNTVLMIAPKNSFKIEYREKNSNGYKLTGTTFVPIETKTGATTNVSMESYKKGDSIFNEASECDVMLFYSIANGCSVPKNNVSYIGGVHLNINSDIDILKDDNFRLRESDELVITGSTKGVNKSDIRGISQGIYDVENEDYSIRTITKNTVNDSDNRIKIDMTNPLSVAFEVSEASFSEEGLNGDTIGDYYNAVKFYDNIWVYKYNKYEMEDANKEDKLKHYNTKDHYGVEGYSTSGIRYYFANRNDYKSLIMSLNNINCSFSDSGTQEAGWQGIWTRQNLDSSRLKNNEITERLKAAEFFTYEPQYDENGNRIGNMYDANGGLNPTNMGGDKAFVIGVYDQYTNLYGSKNDSDSDYYSEYHNQNSMVKRDSSRFAIIKIYALGFRNSDDEYTIRENDIASI